MILIKNKRIILMALIILFNMGIGIGYFSARIFIEEYYKKIIYNNLSNCVYEAMNH